MRSIPAILLGVALTLAGVGVAQAEPPQPSAPGDFAQHAEGRLGDKFERSVGVVSDRALAGLGGPSSMRCLHTVAGKELDTCVVTADTPPNDGPPASLAQN